MAFGTASAIFQYTAKNLLGAFAQSNVAPATMGATGFLGDTMKYALYGNTGTPDKTVATAVLCAYNGAASQWVTANEATGGYTAGGQHAGREGWAVDATAGPCCRHRPAWTITGPVLRVRRAAVRLGNRHVGASARQECCNSFGGVSR